MEGGTAHCAALLATFRRCCTKKTRHAKTSPYLFAAHHKVNAKRVILHLKMEVMKNKRGMYGKHMLPLKAYRLSNKYIKYIQHYVRIKKRCKDHETTSL